MSRADHAEYNSPKAGMRKVNNNNNNNNNNNHFNWSLFFDSQVFVGFCRNRSQAKMIGPTWQTQSIWYNMQSGDA